MSKKEATKIAKSINAWCKREKPFAGGRSFGIDYSTWFAVYPEKAKAFQEAGEVITGRKGRFMPISLNS